jgi:hypothetical protein
MWDFLRIKWHWDRVYPQVLRFSICQFYSTGAPLLRRIKKLIIFLFIFIIGLHNKPQGCGASVASAAGLFATKKEYIPVTLRKVIFATNPVCFNYMRIDTVFTFFKQYRLVFVMAMNRVLCKTGTEM